MKKIFNFLGDFAIFIVRMILVISVLGIFFGLMSLRLESAGNAIKIFTIICCVLAPLSYFFLKWFDAQSEAKS